MRSSLRNCRLVGLRAACVSGVDRRRSLHRKRVFFEFDEPVFGICTWRSGEFRGTDVSSDVSSGMFQRIVSLIILSKRAKRDRPIPKLGGMIVEWLFIAFNYGHVIYLSSAGDNSFCCLACGLSRNTECFRSSLCRAGRALCNPLLLPLPPSLPLSVFMSPHKICQQIRDDCPLHGRRGLYQVNPERQRRPTSRKPARLGPSWNK
jgi:hypothetical protein